MKNQFLILLILFFTNCSPTYSPYFNAIPDPSLSGEILSLNTSKTKDTSSSFISGIILGREYVHNNNMDRLEYSSVVLINHSRNDTTHVLSDNQGAFARKLHAGIYTLRFMQIDYNILEIQGLNLKVGESVKLNIILGTMGSLKQKNPKILKIK